MNRITIGSIISGIGILDTLILLDETYNQSGICGENSGSIFGTPIDCGYVLTTSESKILGIPLALLGFLFYIGIFTLFNLYNENRKQLSHILMTGTVVGLLASSYFVYLQFFVLKRVCLYCMGSATTSTLLFITMILSYKQLKE